MSHSNGNVSVLLAFLCGATVGCVAGLLSAPSSGRKLRKQLRKRSRKLQFAASDLRDRGNEAVERIGEAIADTAETVSTRAKSAVGR